MASNMAGFWLFEPSAKSPRRLEEWLPRGSRLESGRFIVPRVRRGLYQKVCDLEEIASRATACAYHTDESGSFSEAEGIGTEADPTAEDKAETLERLAAVLNRFGGNDPDQN